MAIEDTGSAPESQGTSGSDQTAPQEPQGKDAAQTGGDQEQVTQEALKEYDPSKFHLVPKDATAPWGNDWHEAVRRAKSYDSVPQAALKFMERCSDVGYDPEYVIDYVFRGSDEPTQNQQAQAEQQMRQDLQDQGHSQPDIEKIIQQATAKTLEEYERRQSEQRRAQEMTMAQRAENEAIEKHVEEAGLPEQYRSILGQFVNEEIKEDAPIHATDKQMREHLNRPATKAQIKRAQEKFDNWIKDQRNLAVNNYSQEQQGLPGASLDQNGSGPTNRPMQNMSQRERYAMIQQRANQMERMRAGL